MKLGIYANPLKDADGSVANALKAEADKSGFECAEIGDDISGFDAVAVIGGDGTMLDVAKRCALAGRPVLGVNKGALGFLTEITPDGISDALNRLKTGDYFIERRFLMEIKTDNRRFYSLNEGLVRRDNLNKLCSVKIEIDGEFAGEVKGDGVIVSTPTGSTAYSLSCGGPVIGPDLNLMLVIAVCPHSIHNIPMITGGTSVIKLVCDAEDSRLIVDGKGVAELKKNACVEMTASDVCARFIRFSEQNFYNRLMKKMQNW